MSLHWILLTWVGCAPQGAPAVSADAGARVDPPAQLRGPGLAPLLRAHHPEDLPDRAAIDHHGGVEALWAVAASDPDLVVRARAIELVARYDEPAQVERLLAAAGDPKLSSKLRAAAVVALSRTGAGDRGKVLREVARLVRDDDRRVALEAGAALLRLPGSDGELSALREDVALCPEVRESLGPAPR